MSVGIGTQFAASLAPGQTQTWFTWGWDPNYFLIWSVVPTNSPGQVRLESVQVAYEATGVTYFLTISNTGPWPATFQANYYFKTIVPEADWRSLGPNHISGCIVQVALDPNNSDRIYALAQGGGLWKLDSISGYPAGTWVPLSDQHQSLVGFAFAIAPSNSSVIYLAEGPYFLVSTDGGSTWNSPSNISLWSDGNDPWSPHAARRLVVDPGDEMNVWLASNTGLWQTTDGGGSWAGVIAGDITDMTIDPTDSSIVYVAERNVGVLKSTDAGASWTTILAWSVLAKPVDTMVKIAVGAQGTPATRTIAVKFDQTVFVNNNAGTGAWASSSLASDLGEEQYDWDNVIAVDPFNNNVILAGSQGLQRSTDGGKTWNLVVTYYQPHEDQQSIFFDPDNPGVVYLANDGGVFRSPDHGQTWMSGASWSWNDVFSQKYDLNYSLVTSLFYRVGVSNTDTVGPTAVGPAHHAGLIACPFVKSSEWAEIQGHSWETANTYAFPNQPGAFYLLQGPDLWVQSYPGTALTKILPGIGWPSAVCMDNTPGSTTLFVGTQAGTMYYSTNASTSSPNWTQVTAINLGGDSFVSIVFSASSPGTAYAVSQSGQVYHNPNVAVPQNWVSMASNWNSGEFGNVVQLAVDATDEAQLYLTSSGQIATSADGGATWTAIAGATAGTLGTLAFQSILADPARTQTVFVAGNPGVFISTDGGQTWSEYDEGLPNASASWLQWYGACLYVSTWGRGLWRKQPFADYGDDNVNIETQFTGTLAPGQTQTWFTWGWPQNWFVVWSVRPTTDQGEVSLDRLDVELESTGITYHLTIANTGSQPATFEAKYGFVSF